MDNPPIAKIIPHRLLKEEREEIIRYALEHPEQRHRELWYNLAREGNMNRIPIHISLAIDVAILLLYNNSALVGVR